MVVPTDLTPFGLPFWLDLQRPEFLVLNRNRTAEAVVIGAGIAGLKLARCLNRHGIETVLLEAGRAGDGASSRNQGSINHGPGMNYLACIDRYSRRVARELWPQSLAARQDTTPRPFTAFANNCIQNQAVFIPIRP